MDATLLLHRACTVSRPSGLAMLCVLLVCVLMAHCTAATTTNSTITSSPSGEEHNSTNDTSYEHKDGPKHKIHVLAIEFEAVKEPLIFTVVVLLAGLSKIGKSSLLLQA